MKSEHRHELKTNELAMWIANLPQWAEKNAKTITYVSVVAVLVIASVVFYWYRKDVESVQKRAEFTKLLGELPQVRGQIVKDYGQGKDYSFMLIQTANELQTFAQNTKNNQMAALAFIKRAEALRMELHYRRETPSEQDIATQINQAKSSYAEAVEKASSIATLAAIARLGLGLCEEELGNFTEARQIYNEIAAGSTFEGTSAAAEAKQRLVTMDDFQGKIVFRASPKPAES
jgi:hypothetical protein